MITIDVLVPITGKVYDFTLDENISVATATEEIIELIVQKENYSTDNINEMFLFSKKENVALNTKFSLKENGVETGNRLFLV